MRIVSAVIVALFAVILAAMIHSQANAATLTRHASPTHTACVAFQTWNHHRTTHNLSAMLAASKHANSVVKTDIIVVYTEKVQNDWYDLPADTALTAHDCKGK